MGIVKLCRTNMNTGQDQGLWLRVLIIAVLIVVISGLHYQTTIHEGHFHDIYRRLYYIPIVLGGIWFALRGGISTALVVSVFYLPHVVFQWQHHPDVHLEQYLEILLYNVIGFLTGCLSQRERTQRILHQNTAVRLEKSYAQLKAQADQILEFEEQLRRADRLTALGELTAGLAHEIRNPLGTIRMSAEVLQEAIDPADKRTEFAQLLIKEVNRLNQVVEDFLQFARPAPMEGKFLNLNQTLTETLQLVRKPASENRVQVLFEAGSLPDCPGESVQLKQAFLNLALNAIQAMPEGGTLTVSSRVEDDQIQIVFADSGPGIPEKHRDKIFNPFFTTREGGTGLGLSITHRIIQGHNGRLHVASREGAGTTFTIYLPVPGV